MDRPVAELMIYFGVGVIVIAGSFGIWVYLQWQPSGRPRPQPRKTVVQKRLMSAASARPPEPRPTSALETVDLLVSVALLAVMFAFVDGPVWEHPFDLARSAWLSYVPIPLMVLLILWWRRRLRLSSWLLGVLQLGSAKLGVTLVFMVGLWALSPPPQHDDAVPATLRGVSEAEPDPEPPQPTPWPDDERFSVAGRVVDPEGHGVAGAIVYVSRGLEQVVFSTPTEPVFLELAGGHMRPPVIFLRSYQPLRARSADGRMHNLVAAPGGGTLFNVPLLASGKLQRIRARRGEAFVSLSCTVHGGVEHGQLVLLSHPFHATSDGAGAFGWRGIPKLPLSVRAWHPKSGEAHLEIDPSSNAAVELRLR
jgi:hypothetical protein